MGSDGGQDTRAEPKLGTEALQVFALCGFAIAQPLFDLLGRNSTFLVVHDVGGLELAAYAIALILVPPIVILAVLALVRLISTRVAEWVFCAIAGALVAFILVPILDHIFGFSDAVWLIALIAFGIGGALLFARRAGVRTFATYLSPAPILFLVLFLFVSPAHVLLGNSDPAAVAGSSTATTPVVMLLFDEFALGTLVNGQGQIDAARFPGFARLAKVATWYPNVTTVSTATDRAVPAILSGLVPAPNAAPVASVYPRSLFTLLGRSGKVHAIEDVTHICPNSICSNRATPSPSGLLSDTAIVLGHSVLPSGLESSWLPSLDGQWSNFGDDSASVEPTTANQPTLGSYRAKFHAKLDAQGGRADPITLYNQYLASIRGPVRSGLWYGHFHFPHSGYKRLPDGSLYIDSKTWPDQRQDWPRVTRLSGFQVMRYMMQVAYADHMVSEMLDRLQSQHLLNRSMLIVLADHGQSFEQPKDVRGAKGLNTVNRDEVLPMPLFIKYPKQPHGTIDRRKAETIDVMPTIADALHAQLPADWKFDGTSLLKPAPARQRSLINIKHTAKVISDVHAAKMGAWIRQQMVKQSGDQSDFYRLGPYGAMVGKPVADLGTIAPANGETARVDSAGTYKDVKPGSGLLPAMVRADLSGAGNGWVAVALNGTIAGLGPTFRQSGTNQFAAIANPAYFRKGANTVTIYRVSGDRSAPKLQAVSSNT
jgi:hypothetical protein